MGRFLIIVAGIALGLWLLNFLIPEDIKNRTLAAIGLGNFSLTRTFIETADKAGEGAKGITAGTLEAVGHTFTTAKDEVVETIIPKSPSQKRDALLEKLNEQLEELRRISDSQELLPENKEVINQIVHESEKIIVQIKENNESDGAVSSVIQATVEAISNIGAGSDECPESCRLID